MFLQIAPSGREDTHDRIHVGIHELLDERCVKMPRVQHDQLETRRVNIGLGRAKACASQAGKRGWKQHLHARLLASRNAP